MKNLIFICFFFSSLVYSATVLRSKGRFLIVSKDSFEDVKVNEQVPIEFANGFKTDAKIVRIAKRSLILSLPFRDHNIRRGDLVFREESLAVSEQDNFTPKVEKKFKAIGDRVFYDMGIHYYLGSISQDFQYANETISGSASTEGNLSGAALNFRFGYIWSKFFIATELQYGRGAVSGIQTDLIAGDETLQIKDSSQYDLTKIDLGGLAGLRFNDVWRTWIGLYYTQSALSSTDSRDKFVGNTIKFGASMRVYDAFSVSLEYAVVRHFEENGFSFPYEFSANSINFTREQFKENYIALGVSYSWGGFD